MRNKKYTMVEVLVVVAILFILAGLVLGAVKGCSGIQHHGLKGIVDEIWYGSDAR